MPQRLCCVPSCPSALIDGAVLHKFPNPITDWAKFYQWTSNTGLVEEQPRYVFNNRRICRLHFEQIYHYPKNRLSSIAIPTLNLPDASKICDYFDKTEPIPTTSSDYGITLNKQRTTKKLSQQDSAMPESVMPVCDTPLTVLSPNMKKNITKTRKNLKLNSSGEFELHKIIAKTRYQLSQCQKSKADFIKKLKIARKFTTSEAFKVVSKKLSPAARLFFEMQIRQSLKNPKGHRFSLDEKILALSLYKPSPKAYRLLSQICVLPKKSTLNKLMSKTHICPGYNDVIFAHLKKRVEKMPSCHKYCILLFDEMAISANLSYDKHKDKINGFCDDGNERTKLFADHVLVFMVRGIFKKYKQPVAYSFCAGTTSKYALKNQITCILKKVMSTGLRVVATTCDQGSTNMAAINMLMSDTKEKFMRNARLYKGGFFEIDDETVYPIYDPPHLMKGIRNNLLKKDLQFSMEEKTLLAKWSHIETFYKKGPGFKGMRLVPKLTARHVIPNLIPKMRVKYCTQVFSQSVGIAMGFTSGTARIPKESSDTAELLLFFDKLFDSVNGSFNKITKGKIYRAAVSPKSPHNKLWQKSLKILKTMKYIGGRVGVVRSISSWIKTIESFQQITKKLHTLGLRSLLLRNFNQDPLENFFGAIRAHGHRNIMPTSVGFESSYKALLINNMVTPKSVGANCEEDNGFCLQSLKYFLNQNISLPLPTNNIELSFEHLQIELPNLERLLASKIPRDIEKCAAAAYCSGWIIQHIKKCVAKNCMGCKIDLEGDSEESYCKFIKLKKYTNKCLLHYPSKKMLECILQVEEVILKVMETNCQSQQIGEYIELVVTSLISLNFVSCIKPKEKVKKIILSKTINLLLNDWCREVNYLLCGKSIEWDKGSMMKKSAYDYYVRHHKIKRK